MAHEPKKSSLVRARLSGNASKQKKAKESGAKYTPVDQAAASSKAPAAAEPRTSPPQMNKGDQKSLSWGAIGDVIEDVTRTESGRPMHHV